MVRKSPEVWSPSAILSSSHTHTMLLPQTSQKLPLKHWKMFGRDFCFAFFVCLIMKSINAWKKTWSVGCTSHRTKGRKQRRAQGKHWTDHGCSLAIRLIFCCWVGWPKCEFWVISAGSLLLFRLLQDTLAELCIWIEQWEHSFSWGLYKEGSTFLSYRTHCQQCSLAQLLEGEGGKVPL